MTNFDFLKEEKRFDSFTDVAISAEKLYNVDIDSCVLACRRAMEFAVKWMYSVGQGAKSALSGYARQPYGYGGIP